MGNRHSTAYLQVHREVNLLVENMHGDRWAAQGLALKTLVELIVSGESECTLAIEFRKRYLVKLQAANALFALWRD